MHSVLRRGVLRGRMGVDHGCLYQRAPQLLPKNLQSTFFFHCHRFGVEFIVIRYGMYGKLVSDDSPGRAGNQGPRLLFLVNVRDPNNPIIRGLPKTLMRQGDEFYSKLRGPGDMTVLAAAYIDPATY